MQFCKVYQKNVIPTTHFCIIACCVWQSVMLYCLVCRVCGLFIKRDTNCKTIQEWAETGFLCELKCAWSASTERSCRRSKFSHARSCVVVCIAMFVFQQHACIKSWQLLGRENNCFGIRYSNSPHQLQKQLAQGNPLPKPRHSSLPKLVLPWMQAFCSWFCHTALEKNS